MKYDEDNCTFQNDECTIQMIPYAIFSQDPLVISVDVVDGVLRKGQTFPEIDGNVTRLSWGNMKGKTVDSAKVGDPSITVWFE